MPVGIALTATDVEGDALSYQLVSPPAHGTLSGTPPNVVYTPASNYNGPDGFTFVAKDGTSTSNVATVQLSIAAVNDAPTANAGSLGTDEDAPVAVTLTGSDVEQSALTFTVVTAPTHGTLSGTAPNLTYTPDADFHGEDSLSFQVRDGELDSAVATVSLSVASINDAPVAQSRSAEVLEDQPTAMALEASDVDGDALAFTVTAAPAHGTLSGEAPALTYTPDANYHGPDSFSFRVHDGTVDSPVATVSIDVVQVNDAPVANGAALRDRRGHGARDRAHRHGRRGRRAHLRGRRAARPRQPHRVAAGGHLHPGRGLPRRRPVHLQGERRPGGLRGRDGGDHRAAR